MLVNLQEVSKSFLDNTVLRDVSLAVQENDRVGLLGINGAGKTTLLNILTGDIQPDAGVVTRARNLSIGYLRQNDALEGSRTLDEEIREAFSAITLVSGQMNDCTKALAAAPDDAQLLAEYDCLVTRFEAMDGYHMDDKINRVLNGLGFGGFTRTTLVSTLSGGEKMRFAVAKILLQNPDVLILDEPTNHLDFTMLAWLEGYLATYKGAVLVVSHDRYFLDAVAKDICEIERHALIRYSGGYSSFVTQKAERFKAAMKTWEKQQVDIAKLEEFVRKNLARSASASGVGTRVKALEKMERLEKPKGEPKTISLRFTYDLEPFETVLQCEHLGVKVGDGGTSRQLFEEIALTVRRGEAVALVGLNGVGKSTFLKAIQNRASHTGRVQWGGNARVGYFDQELAGLPMDEIVLEAVHSRFPTKTEYEIRSALGRMLLEGEDAYKKVRELSGAGRAKVAFTILIMQKSNVLLLDEPTNHLDYRAKEALEVALRQYTGTLVAVSHDRYFLRRVPGRILEMRPDGFDEYNGNYDYYVEKSAEAKAAPVRQDAKEESEREAPARDASYRTKKQRAEDSQRRSRVATLEKEIARLEVAIETSNEGLAHPDNASDYEVLAALSQSLKEDSAAVDEVMQEWMTLTEVE